MGGGRVGGGGAGPGSGGGGGRVHGGCRVGGDVIWVDCGGRVRGGGQRRNCRVRGRAGYVPDWVAWSVAWIPAVLPVVTLADSTAR